MTGVLITQGGMIPVPDVVDDCLPPPVVDMSNGVDDPFEDGVTEILDCEAWDPDVAPAPGPEDGGGADGIVNDIPRSAAIGCQGLRADRLSSLPVILAFRNDLKAIKKK